MATLDDMPKDGSPFLAVVNDWYTRERRYHLLKMNINGYWDTAYTGNQTFEREDIVECQALPALTKLPRPAPATGAGR